MAKKITKLPGAGRVYYFIHDGVRYDPTPEGIVVPDGAAAGCANDPWLKVEDATEAELEAFEKAEVIRKKAAAKMAAEPKPVGPKISPLDRGRKVAEIRAQLAQLERQKAAVAAQVKAVPARKAAAAKRTAQIEAEEKALKARLAALSTAPVEEAAAPAPTGRKRAPKPEPAAAPAPEAKPAKATKKKAAAKKAGKGKAKG